MEIKINCRACDRAFPLSMAVDQEGRPGHCPFCGEVLAFQYSTTFVTTAEQVILQGAEFVRQLTLLAELAGGFAIVAESVLDPVREAMDVQLIKTSVPYRPGWPPRTGEPVA